MLGIIAGIVAILYISLIALALSNSKSRYRKSNYAFALLIFFSLLWVIGVYLFSVSVGYSEQLLGARAAWIPGPLLGASLFVFCSIYTKELSGEIKNVKLEATSLIISLLFALMAAFTDLVVKDINPDIKKIAFGPLYFPLFIYIFVLVIWASIVLAKARSKVNPTNLSQLKIITVGIVSTGVFALISNLVTPLVVGNSSYSFLGIFTTIPLNIAITYSVFRHKFLDIRVLIGRIIYYTTLALLPFSIFFILVYFYVDVFGSVFSPPVYLLSIPIAVGFVLMFNWINDILRNQVTTRLINPGYNPLETAERLSNELSVMIELPPIANAITSTLSRTVRPDFSAIVILPDEKHAADRTYTSDNRALADLTKLKNAVTTLWNTVGKHPIILEEIDIEVAEGLYRNVPNIAQELKAEMNHLGIRILLALGQDNVFGLFAIGQKEADSSYTNSDVEFLKSIANTGSLAVQRSLLYSEVQEFAQTLQKKVDDATTELKKANTDLQSALSQLQEARRVERDMIDVMGHELRTPISIVRNALVMMGKHQERNKHLTSEELKKYMDMALESTRREITMIETLLSATKVDNARIQLYLVKSDMVDMVDDAIEGQKVPISQKNLEIIFHRPPEPVWVYADRTRAQEITDNFLSNAVKYTLAGSVEINVWKDDKYGYTSIKDTGIGISEEDLQNLGKKFFRAKQHIPKKNGSDTEVVRPGGTGLGLYVTFDLIKIMGGSLYINSKVGEGTTFTFCLPSYVDQPEKQVDQTFDNNHEDTKANIFLNKAAPQPPEK